MPSWHVPKIVGRSYSSLTILTAAPRRHKLHIVRFRIVHENSLISLLLLFPKSLLDFSGTLLCSLHRPPDAVASVAPETRRSSVQCQLNTEKTRHTKWCSEFLWLRGPDLNRRPPGYEPDELPGCSTPRYLFATV